MKPTDSLHQLEEERAVPWRDPGLYAGHRARYGFAAPAAAGRRVLDVGCGEGYGAAELAGRASAVVAVDYSPAAIAHAREKYQVPNLTFEVMDALELENGRFTEFDLVTCFEVIEHLEDQDRAFDELARLLAPRGLLLISSPNRDRYVPGNPHHRHEFTRTELQGALEARFAAVQIISQHVMLASVISRPSAALAGDLCVERIVEPSEDDEIYLLGMAGSELPRAAEPIVALTRFTDVRRWLAHIDAQKKHIDGQAERLRELDHEGDERRQVLAQLAQREQEMARLIARVGELEPMRAALRSSEERAQAQAEALDHLQQRLQSFATSRSWRLTAPFRQLGARARRA